MGATLQNLRFACTLATSFDDATERVRTGSLETIIADWTALAPSEAAEQSPHTLAEQISASIARLRSIHAAQQPYGWVRAASPLRVIVTTDDANPTAHAAAIQAGADACLRTDEALSAEVLGAYLTRFLQLQVMLQHARGVVGEAPPAAAPPDDAPSVAAAAPESHVTDAFELRDEDLRAPDTGRWDAKRIANALAITLKDLTDAVGVNYSTVARTPDSDALQQKLAPFANVIAMTRQAYDQDEARLRKWLQHPQSALGNTSPLKALLEPGQAPAVEQWVAGAWLGESA